MFWNWYTTDACFLFSNLHITSSLMFAAFCIGTFALVIVLECLRRLQRDYDRQLSYHDHHHHHHPSHQQDRPPKFSETDPDSAAGNYADVPHSAIPLLHNPWMQQSGLRPRGYLPNAIQQAIRASIYTLQFVIAYTLMLLAMYYNG